MNRLKISNPVILFVIVTLLIINCIGCVTITEKPTKGETKSDIREIWGKPNKVYHKGGKVKYGADEVWIYEYMGGNAEERLYFRENILIKRENISYATL